MRLIESNCRVPRQDYASFAPSNRR